ncbi:hypothetical protein M409DRAFT_57367 [Zasmidium cellare ATCC 36951]|uniref:Proline dehydrogenase n=1 Tax=Zasmidium cellare ATCC 36951 TaxID=1080233 RepID=A0A6A6CC21_ZASCE|nr:uncharacterized protein M409DRAFT_57367 [Zasmidium cellare ATCC 36951]KAF2163462.1 hypothetical protein M409DRAFT_57367 [Zasmidium cellare ATCC 36951]
MDIEHKRDKVLDARQNWILASTSLRQRAAAFAVGGGLVTAAVLITRQNDSPTEDQDPRDLARVSNVPMSKLVSGWIAFAFCSSPTWVDISEPMYGVVSKIPLVSYIAHVFIRYTFVNQFLGGEDVDQCIPRMRDLREHEVGTLLGYNIEAKLDGSSKDPELVLEQTRCVLESIDAQGKMARQCQTDSTGSVSSDIGTRCWGRIKLTGLLTHPIALQHASDAILQGRREKGLDRDVPYPGLPHDGDWDAAINGQGVTESDREQLLTLRATMEAISSKARDNKVRIVIDAEQSWYQPAIDALTDELMQTYNSTTNGPATIITSFQAYLRRHPQLIEQQIRRADEKGYRLLFKQVRGAYIATERSRSEKVGLENPVWPSKAETDASFNGGMETALSAVAEQIEATGSSNISAVFATHNSQSIGEGIDALKQKGLIQGTDLDGRLKLSKEAAGSVAFAQLYGMKDDLTNKITGTITSDDGMPLVVKVSRCKNHFTAHG